MGKRSVTLYRSPSQSKDDFETFRGKLEPDWWYKNCKTTHEGFQIANFTSHFGLKQIMNQPIHILSNSSSCIELIFHIAIKLSNRVSYSFITTSNCHYQIIHPYFNLNIYYPPPYEHDV